MKKITLLTVILAFLVVFPLFSISKEDFDRVAVFNRSIESLGKAFERGVKIDTDKFYILNGTVSSVKVVNRKRASYEVLVEIVSGRWIGLDRIEVYKVVVRFKGPQFYGFILTRRPRRVTRPLVLPNTGVLFVGKVTGEIKPLSSVNPKDRVLLLDGVYIKPINF